MKIKKVVLIVSLAVVVLQCSLGPASATQIPHYQDDVNIRIEEKRKVFDTFTFVVDYSTHLTYEAVLSVILAENTSSTFKIAPYVLLNTKGESYLNKHVYLDYNITSSYSGTEIKESGTWLDIFTYSANPVNQMEMPPFSVPLSSVPLTLTVVLEYHLTDVEGHFDERGITTQTFAFTGINQDVVFISTVLIGVAILYVIAIALIIRQKHQGYGSSTKYKKSWVI